VTGTFESGGNVLSLILMFYIGSAHTLVKQL
jgi:hypothetical protein